MKAYHAEAAGAFMLILVGWSMMNIKGEDLVVSLAGGMAILVMASASVDFTDTLLTSPNSQNSIYRREPSRGQLGIFTALLGWGLVLVIVGCHLFSKSYIINRSFSLSEGVSWIQGTSLGLGLAISLLLVVLGLGVNAHEPSIAQSNRQEQNETGVVTHPAQVICLEQEASPLSHFYRVIGLKCMFLIERENDRIMSELFARELAFYRNL